MSIHDFCRMVIGAVAGLVVGYVCGRLDQWRQACINCEYRRAAHG